MLACVLRTCAAWPVSPSGGRNIVQAQPGCGCRGPHTAGVRGSYAADVGEGIGARGRGVGSFGLVGGAGVASGRRKPHDRLVPRRPCTPAVARSWRGQCGVGAGNGAGIMGSVQPTCIGFGQTIARGRRRQQGRHWQCGWPRIRQAAVDKLDARWQDGTMLGINFRTNEPILGKADDDEIVKAWSIRRVPETERWDADALLRLRDGLEGGPVGLLVSVAGAGVRNFRRPPRHAAAPWHTPIL